MRLGRFMHSSPVALVTILACGPFAVACAEGAPAYMTPTADRAVFAAEVLPVLVRDCGFHACHGSSSRFFQVFGPGHGRLAPDTRPLDELTAAEIEHSYLRALSMIDPAAREQSPLLRKPLAVAAGGAGHEGTDSFGRDVYQSTQDGSYLLLRAWVMQQPLPTPPVNEPGGTR